MAMSMLKTLIAGMFAAGLTFTAGAARAELITYEFTATINHDGDPSNVLAYGSGDVVTGTFSYDTDAAASDGGVYSEEVDGFTGGYAYYYNAGSVSTGPTKTEYLAPDFIAIEERNEGGGGLDHFFLVDFGSSTGGGPLDEYGYEYILLQGYSNVFNGASLPTTLSLEDFSTALYGLNSSVDGVSGFVQGTITSLARVGAKDVPELSASGLGSAFFLLAGAGHILTRRREHGVVAA